MASTDRLLRLKSHIMACRFCMKYSLIPVRTPASLDAQLADILGFDVIAGRPHDVSGITGEKETYYVHPVTVLVGGWQYEIEAGFLERIGRFGYGVVGQRGFFDLFTVAFGYQKKMLE